jgi:hypothetical protein
VDLILEKKENNHVVLIAAGCRACMRGQHELVGDADNVRVTAHGVD